MNRCSVLNIFSTGKVAVAAAAHLLIEALLMRAALQAAQHIATNWGQIFLFYFCFLALPPLFEL